jgi:hypothetical protein
VTVSLRISDERHYSHCSSMDTPQDSAPPTVTKLTKAPQRHIMSVTRGIIHTAVHKTHERSTVSRAASCTEFHTTRMMEMENADSNSFAVDGFPAVASAKLRPFSTFTIRVSPLPNLNQIF